MTAYAIKNEKGRSPARAKLNLKLSMISGTSGPIMLVRKETTKKIKNIRQTKK